MTKERARYYAERLAFSMGITFYAVRSREGRFFAVQVPLCDCEILATVTAAGRRRSPTGSVSPDS